MLSRLLAAVSAAFCLIAAGTAHAAIVYEQTGVGDASVQTSLPGVYAGDWRATILTSSSADLEIVADWYVTWSYFEWSTKESFFGNDYFLGDLTSGPGTLLTLLFTLPEDVYEGPFVDDLLTEPYGFPSGTEIGYLEAVTGGQVFFGIYNADPDATWTVRLERLDVGGVPEPGAWLLMIAGLAATGAALRRRPVPARVA